MSYTNRYRRFFIPIMVLLLTMLFMLPMQAAFAEGGTAALTEDALPENAPETVIRVHSVDELLAALGSDRVILLESGEYNLTAAGNYGQFGISEDWYWDYSYDGFQLAIRNVSGMWLVGEDSSLCSIVTEPRYANVLHFENCSDLHLQNFTAGHSPGEGYCSGGVLDFMNCSGVEVSGCDLYGCGTYGISACDCRCLYATDTVIHDCTYGAIQAVSCLDVRFSDGQILHCGVSKEYGADWTAFNLLQAETCTGFYVLNTEIADNVTQTVFCSNGTLDCLIGGCSVHDNVVGEHGSYSGDYGQPIEYEWGGMFSVSGKSVTVTGTEFSRNRLIVSSFFDRREQPAGMSPVTDENGNPLDRTALENMNREAFDPGKISVPDPGAGTPAIDSERNEAGLTVCYVSTADEFLAAIGSNTVIHVDAGLIDFSSAQNYGGYGGSGYYWMDNYDGPGLVISGVVNLYIEGAGKGQTILQATPRYSDVLYFDGCSDITISNLTAGHLEGAPGSCAGDVFEFLNCSDVSVKDCGLFGCGVNAISGQYCSNFFIENTEMYNCSEYGVSLWNCDHFVFSDCSIHDCTVDGLLLYDTHHILWNGQPLESGDAVIPPQNGTTATPENHSAI